MPDAIAATATTETAATSAPVAETKPAAETPSASKLLTRDAKRAAWAKSEPAKSEAPKAETKADEVKPTEAPKAETKVEAKPDAKPDEKPDPQTDRGLAQLEKQRKRFLDEQAASKAELEVQRAEVARLRQDASGKASSIDELKKLDVPTLLEKLGLDDGRLTLLSREAYYRTSEGQKDPRAKQAVDDVRRLHSVTTMEDRYAAMEERYNELNSKLEAAQRLVFQREYANKWVDKTIGEFPADKPTLFSKLHAKNPDQARNILLAIGGELEKANGDAAPTASEVLAEYEKRARANLESMGVDPEVYLAPPAPKVEAKPEVPATETKSRTLPVGSTTVTRPESGKKSREEKRALALDRLAKNHPSA